MPSNDTSRPDAAQNAPVQRAGSHEIQVAGPDLEFKPVRLDDTTPTGAQIAAALGYRPDQQVTVLHWFGTTIEDIRPDEIVKLREGETRFIAAPSDGAWRLTFDGQRIDWLARHISVATLRRLANIPSELSIYLEHEDEPDELLDESRQIDLGLRGVERLISRRATWKLNVQGELLTLHAPTIVVREALHQAGFNPDQGWHIYLKVEGQPKEPVELDTVIDLRRKGIEKLRLTPKDVINGEGPSMPLRAFPVLNVDEAFLNAKFPSWEAVLDGGRQWILLPDFTLPPGYSVQQVRLALEIQPTYPAVEIDMFYMFPAVTLNSGAQIPAADAMVAIRDQQFQRWSRHRSPAGPWKPGYDNVKTHLALVDNALLKEVQQ
ncbi:multiubiquitin domain-containing protein [Variovorax sp. RB3P1]|uniref:multiubiquitin domain-containing protein n=1 Tax=Variovorax sp. RB3P1 TaxID=3443732 RepID=UPI003F48F189